MHSTASLSRTALQRRKHPLTSTSSRPSGAPALGKRAPHASIDAPRAKRQKTAQAERPQGAALPLLRSSDAGAVRALADLPTIAEALGAEASLPLQEGTRSFFVRAAGTRAPAGLVLMFHGFSAGTFQHEDFARRFAADGFHVYAPRLEGHGHGTGDIGDDDTSNLPSAGQHDRYRAFADEMHRQASSAGLPIHVIGLSGGGAVALDLATRHPDVKTAGLVDPFFGPEAAMPAKLFAAFEVIDAWSFHLGSQLLNLVPYTFPKAMADRERWGRPGHHKVTAGNIYALTRFGRGACEGARLCTAPVQMVTTESGVCVSRDRLLHLYASRDPKATGWHDFPAAEGVPHTMTEQRENPDDASRDRVFEVLHAHLTTGRLTNRLPAQATPAP